MSRKVFISVLGTSLYRACKYKRDEFISRKTSFIQEATLSYLHAEQWQPDDQIYILTTPMAKECNWDASITQRSIKDKDPVPYCGLEKILKEMHLPCSITNLEIQENPDKEKEMWDIFTTLYNHLQQDDELYIDLTHGFRYLPMLVLVFCNYASYLKNITVASLTYGNFEGSTTDEKNIEDLIPLSELQDWTFAAATFRKFGSMSSLSASLKEGRDKWTRNESKGTLKEFCNKIQKNIEELDQEIKTCRGYELQSGKTAFEIKGMIQKTLRSNKLPAPISNLLYEIQHIINPFEDNTQPTVEKSLSNLKHVIDWCIQYGMVQQGYTLGQESIITLLYDELEPLNPYVQPAPENETSSKRKKRERDQRKNFRIFISSVIGINQEDLNNRATWKEGLSAYPDLALQIISQPWYSELKKPYEALTESRNKINHGEFHQGATSPSDLTKNLKDNIKKCFDVLEKYQGQIFPKQPENTLKEKLLINLSNHPSSQWSTEQSEAATVYGPCIDYPFPQVSPEADTTDIRDMAVKVVSDILNRYPDKDLTIHLMGEMTLTFQMVSLFSKQRIPCIASTTERLVTQTDNQERICKFLFRRFRKYN